MYQRPAFTAVLSSLNSHCPVRIQIFNKYRKKYILRQEILYHSALVCASGCMWDSTPSLWHIPALKRPRNRWGSDTHHLRMISVNFGTFTYLKAQSGRSALTYRKAILRRSAAAPLRCPHCWGIHFTKEEMRRSEKKNHILILYRCFIHSSLLSCDKNGWFLLRSPAFNTLLHISHLSQRRPVPESAWITSAELFQQEPEIWGSLGYLSGKTNYF